ncbi:hypothetical protein PINS_up015989 [Pythium insidiosum]|nr:hypothetical protein PINS_up015989 [Pythium insidiosum]
MLPVPRCNVRLPCTARRPVVFRFTSLLPGRDYRVVFDGVHRDDVQSCSASFRTPSLERPPTLRCGVVSADNVYEVEYAEPSLWSTLRRAVAAPDDPESQDRTADRLPLVLHLGGQVAMQRMFDKAWAMMVRQTECVQPPVAMSGPGDEVFVQAWADIEHQVMEILRSAYRTQWMLVEDKRFVLANASNLMMWSDWDVYPAFTTSKTFYVDHSQPTIEMQVLRTVMRCARRVYHEYQRALWDDDVEKLIERDGAMRSVAEEALATAAKIHSLKEAILLAAADLDLQKKRREIEGARRAERHLRALEAEKARLEKDMISFNQLVAPQRGEEFLFTVGDVGILMLDMRGNRVEAGGSQLADNDILSNAQWDFIEQELERTDLRTLIVCCESPVIDDLPQELRRAGTNGVVDFKTWWGNNSACQQRLLTLLFEWKLQQAGRSVALLSGSCNARFSMKTVVKDLRLRTDILQWMVGPVTASPSHLVLPRLNGILFERFSYEHLSTQSADKSIAKLEVGVESDSTHLQCVQIDRSSQECPAQVLVGPVIGYVDATSAVILLEVDRECDLICVVENALTGESHRIFEHFHARKPQSFYAAHLRSEHHYQVSFERIDRADQFRGSFKTPARFPDSFDVIALTMNSPSSMGHLNSKSALWPTLAAEISDAPFQAPDLTVVFDYEYEDEIDLLPQVQLREEVHVAESVREKQRLKWNSPGFRHLLAHGAHLIVASPTLASELSSHPHHLSMKRVVQSVRLEYANLLLPPSLRVVNTSERSKLPVVLQFGAVGVFQLPDTRIMETADDFWRSLEKLLSRPHINLLILVAWEPIIEDSIEDVEEKARFDDTFQTKLVFHQHQLRRLLAILLQWQSIEVPIERKQRQALVLCGHRLRSFDSVFVRGTFEKEPSMPCWIPQYVVGPFYSNSNSCLQQNPLKDSMFPQGTVLDMLSYYHRLIKPVESRSSNEDGSMNGTASQPLNVIFHLSLVANTGESNNDVADLTPRFVCSKEVEFELPPEEDAFTVAPRLLVIVNNEERARQEWWRLVPKKPQWLQRLVGQSMTEAENSEAGELNNQLAEKNTDLDAAFSRHSALASALVSLSDRRGTVAAVKQVIDYFHKQLCGLAFRVRYPVSPSVFVIAFTVDELQSNQELPSSGAMDVNQFRTVARKAFINSWLLDSRLKSYWKA